MGNSSHNEKEDRSIAIGGNEIKGSAYIEELKGSGYTEGNTYYIEKIVLPAIAASDRSKSEKILLQQVGAEIASRLKQSLHKQIFINVAKEDRPDRVRRPWDYEVKVGSQEREKLSPETTILQVFDRSDIRGRLLILGQPGSGKTTTLLDLAGELLARAQNPKESIPVLLGLSSWASKEQSILEWLVEELKSKYGVRSDIGKKWLQEGKLLPLLDGLDEVRSDRQGACIEALNRWISGDVGDSAPGQFVVCSRIEEYEQLETRLQMNGAVCLRELSREQIRGYLQSVGRSHLWSLIEENGAIADLVRAPLFLSMMVIGDRSSPEVFQQLREGDNAKCLLLDMYIEKMLGRAKDYTPRQMRLWLVWLAKQMEIDQQTEFLVEKIQPDWLQNDKLERIYYSRVRLPIGLSAGINVGFMTGLVIGLRLWLSGELDSGMTLVALFIGLVCGSFFGLIEGLSAGPYFSPSKIAPIDRISWSWRNAKKGLNVGLNTGRVVLITAPVWGLLVGLINGLGQGLSVTFQYLFAGIVFAIAIGIMSSLFSGLIIYEIEETIAINQGIWKSLQLGLIFMLLGWVLIGLICAIFGGWVGFLFGSLINTWTTKILGVCIRHLFLRQLLYENGLVPWNYAHFLLSCRECLLLQQVGGRFRFIHKTVQEHFAAMEFEKP